MPESVFHRASLAHAWLESQQTIGLADPWAFAARSQKTDVNEVVLGIFVLDSYFTLP